MTPPLSLEVDKTNIKREETSHKENTNMDYRSQIELREDLRVEDIWNAPPLELPGPDNHPFFSIPWESLDLQEESWKLQGGSPTTSSTYQHQHIHQDGPPPIYPFGPPLVYPFIPVPTLHMLPTTPESEPVQNFAENTAGSPSFSTPELSTTSTNMDSSPRSLASVSATNKDSSPQQLPPDAWITSLPPRPFNSEGEAKSSSPSLSPQPQPICHLTYMRAVPNETTTEPAVLLNGQVWRSGTSTKKGWRRNQWVVEVR